MQKKVLADADALIAIVNEDDTNHKKAENISDRLLKEEALLHVSPFTIAEAVTVLSCRMGQQFAKRFLKNIRGESFVELEFIKEAKEKTDEIFLSQNKKGTSWFDCANVALIKIYSLNSIFSFDKFYRKVGIKMLK